MKSLVDNLSLFMPLLFLIIPLCVDPIGKMRIRTNVLIDVILFSNYLL